MIRVRTVPAEDGVQPVESVRGSACTRYARQLESRKATTHNTVIQSRITQLTTLLQQNNTKIDHSDYYAPREPVITILNALDTVP